MTEACATCGADDELLFTCRHCERRFCERHELPPHACDRFRDGARTPEPSDETAATADTEAGSEPEPVAAAVVDADADVDAGAEVESAPTPTPEAAVTSQRERSVTTTEPAAPDDTGGTETPAETPAAPVRPMDSERAVGVVSPATSPRSLGEWLARQTYLTLLFKVGGLALLINVAFYGGVALTLYDPFGIL